MPTPRATILLPAHNEEQSIPQVVRDVRKAISHVPFPCEILLVDDGSTDRTEAVGVECGVRMVRHHRRKGAGAAVKTAIIEARGDLLLLMDADGTYPADSIPAFLSLLDENRQVVGARKQEAGTHPLLRATVKTLFRKLGEFLVRQPIPDINSGMRAFRRRDALAFLHLLPDGHSCVSTLTLCFLAMGLPVRFEPIDYFPRIGDSKFRVVRDTLRFLAQIIRTVTYFAPLRVFLSASLAFFAAGAGKSAWDWHRKGGLEESDIILFTFAAATGMMGLLADLIVRQSRKQIADELFPLSSMHRKPEETPP